MEQADGNWIRRKKNGMTVFSAYHSWLKKATSRQIRRLVKRYLQKGEEPPRKFGYNGWES